jgi:hypothetical protein
MDANGEGETTDDTDITDGRGNREWTRMDANGEGETTDDTDHTDGERKPRMDAGLSQEPALRGRIRIAGGEGCPHRRRCS